MCASVEGADGTVPRGRHCRADGRAAPLSDDARPTPTHAAAATAADTAQQRATVGGTDTTWLTVAYTTYLVEAVAAALESVTRSCIQIATGASQ